MAGDLVLVGHVVAILESVARHSLLKRLLHQWSQCVNCRLREATDLRNVTSNRESTLGLSLSLTRDSGPARRRDVQSVATLQTYPSSATICSGLHCGKSRRKTKRISP